MGRNAAGVQKPGNPERVQMRTPGGVQIPANAGGVQMSPNAGGVEMPANAGGVARR